MEILGITINVMLVRDILSGFAIATTLWLLIFLLQKKRLTPKYFSRAVKDARIAGINEERNKIKKEIKGQKLMNDIYNDKVDTMQGQVSAMTKYLGNMDVVKE